jgi:hypothetical protein
MAENATRVTGGCLCGALRYEVSGEPLFAGLCFCEDCRKASGSGFIPFMGVAGSTLTLTGESRSSEVKAFRGGVATRNHCSRCGGLVFGGVRDESDSFTIYAGSLDDPSQFRPQIAIFASRRPDWAVIPEGLTVFDEMPPQA